MTALACVLALVAGLISAGAPAARAADLSKFDPSNIISDANFYNGGAMSAAEIQSFLQSKVSACRAGNTCLIDFRATTPTRAADSYCAAYTGAANETAAQIIERVGKACNINPRVLIVLLQKEQGLVQNSAPGAIGSSRWNKATGFACPDTAPCDERYFGFFNQVYMAARQFQIYGQSTFFSWFPVGRPSSVGYHPNASCGASTLTIKNKATAALYYYTPYQPNRAAIAAGYGTGDSCSSYGNRNFYSYYTDWFGATGGGGQVTTPPPTGNLEIVSARAGEIFVQGWSYVPGHAGAVAMEIRVDGAVTRVDASQSRPDVGAAYPGAGNNRGFSARIPVTRIGSAEVCVTGTGGNPALGTNFGCRTLALPAGTPPDLGRTPIGTLDLVTAGEGSVTVKGWAIDPDTLASVNVEVSVGGKISRAVANKTRSDVGAIHSLYGPSRGFEHTVTGVSGNQSICVSLLDSGNKGKQSLGCVTRSIEAPITEQGRLPIGSLDSVTVDGDVVTVQGWTIDPDTKNPIQIHVYVGGRSAAFTADVNRPDVGRAYPRYGANHGFKASLKGNPGVQQVCVYGIDTAGRGNPAIGCKTVTLTQGLGEAGRLPIGNLEVIKAEHNKVTVKGWTIDPDTKDPIQIHVYVGGRSAAFTANESRPDVGRAYPLYGPNHGFNVTLEGNPGVQTACVYAIDSAGRGNSPLGCKTFTLTAPPKAATPPVAHFEGATGGAGTVSVVGWAFGPDAPTAPLTLVLEVGSSRSQILANQPRGDVGRAYPQAGNNHGFATTVRANPGEQRVCVSAPDPAGVGPAISLGCRTVRVS